MGTHLQSLKSNLQRGKHVAKYRSTIGRPRPENAHQAMRPYAEDGQPSARPGQLLPAARRQRVLELVRYLAVLCHPIQHRSLHPPIQPLQEVRWRIQVNVKMETDHDQYFLSL